MKVIKVRRSFTKHKSAYQAILGMVCWAVLCGFGAAVSQASIVQPAACSMDFEQMLAQIEEGEASSTSSPAEQSAPLANENQNNPSEHSDFAKLLASALTPVEGSTSGASTTSTGGATGSGSTPIHTLSSTTTPDLALVGWTQGEARFALPMPPGNDLLRPPQV